MDINQNLEIYNKCREVPAEAQKKINGGNLNGFTDINSMWRIKKLTEIFGVCGFGWYYEIVKTWKEDNLPDDTVRIFTEVALYVKMENEWSKPIIGTGGNKLISSDKRGLTVSDECYKMALSDALGVCCKALGIGADVYFSEDRTKYTEFTTKTYNKTNEKLKEYKCDVCHTPFQEHTTKKGRYYNKQAMYKFAKDKSFKTFKDNIVRCELCFNKDVAEMNEGNDIPYIPISIKGADASVYETLLD